MSPVRVELDVTLTVHEALIAPPMEIVFPKDDMVDDDIVSEEVPEMLTIETATPDAALLSTLDERNCNVDVEIVPAEVNRLVACADEIELELTSTVDAATEEENWNPTVVTTMVESVTDS